MKRTAAVARTAADLEHLNRLRTATFGVRELRLLAGTQKSHSYLADGAPPPATEDKGTDGFHFAPGQEKARIAYVLEDRAAQLTKGTLELFRRGKVEPIWKKALEAKDLTHGEHSLEWDGTIDKDPQDFPEGLITAEHSPYKLKLTLEGSGTADSPVAWTYFHVLLHSLELELGDKALLTRPLDLALWASLVMKAGSVAAVVPAPGATREIRLVSNLFSTGNDKNNNTAFTAYKTLWDKGPHLPLVAKFLVRKSDGTKVDAPKAVGKVRLQWDFEDVPEDTSRHYLEAREYLDASLDRYKATTKPKGDNCHKDHGGKRGDATQSVFPTPPNTFPFKVEQATSRKWSAYSEAAVTGPHQGRTGVLFQPSRMAGDAYTLTVRFPYVRKPDGKDDLDTEDDTLLKHALSASTGAFQVWREVHLVKYRKKDASITSINLATVQDYYEKAWLRLEDKTAGTIDGMPGYDAKLRTQVNALVGPRQYVLEDGDQGTLTQSAALYRSRADFKAKLAAAMGWTAAQVNTWVNANIGASMSNFEDFLESVTDTVVPLACDGYLSALEGINILQFNLYWETTDGVSSGTNGFASTDFPSMGLNRAAYLQTRMNYGGGLNNMQQTTTHEIGHILFLPHTVTEGGPAGLHDDTAHWNNCTMSYNYNQERKFCGLCLLRLRGWDQTNLDKDRTRNKKV
ncbi:hypothetical protein HPC49_13150 [Pyxidicoccus fallax]|uniref:Uncharacterized protein n=1 Tax=Pyxidicoccus fallax TaxID=394095 RepID=A0A848LH41_9BACT|nr:hypothetical protein [Pyxidicoccus fallax]NMO17213.1 hypothetical protein [Pyxidicoccus fallax]NPC79181.1 hypothetical protein [Pyxidicoccus fallax]